MSDVAALIADMVRAGVDPELIGRTAAAFADQPKPRTAGAIRQERYRERNKPSQVTPSDGCDAVSPALDKEIPPTPPKEIKPTPLPPVVSAREQFAEFWKLFPNKVGKRDAEREFGFALQRSSFDEIMDGLCRYVGKRDDRPWCNPSTFLHQDRWADQPAEAVPQRRSTAPPAHQGDGYNAVLNGIINGKHDEHAGPTIDTSYDRTDRGSSANLVQFDAFSKGYRS